MEGKNLGKNECRIYIKMNANAMWKRYVKTNQMLSKNVVVKATKIIGENLVKGWVKRLEGSSVKSE